MRSRIDQTVKREAVQFARALEICGSEIEPIGCCNLSLLRFDRLDLASNCGRELARENVVQCQVAIHTLHAAFHPDMPRIHAVDEPHHNSHCAFDAANASLNQVLGADLAGEFAHIYRKPIDVDAPVIMSDHSQTAVTRQAGHQVLGDSVGHVARAGIVARRL